MISSLPHSQKFFNIDYSFFEILFWLNIFIKQKNIYSIFIASLVKSIHLTPHAANFTPFSSPIPATYHFNKFGFKPKNDENKEIVCSNSFTEPKFLRKKLCHLHKLYI